MKIYTDEEIYNNCYKSMDLPHAHFKKKVQKEKWIKVEELINWIGDSDKIDAELLKQEVDF